jgi:hypothetical protein
MTHATEAHGGRKQQLESAFDHQIRVRSPELVWPHHPKFTAALGRSALAIQQIKCARHCRLRERQKHKRTHQSGERLVSGAAQRSTVQTAASAVICELAKWVGICSIYLKPGRYSATEIYQLG